MKIKSIRGKMILIIFITLIPLSILKIAEIKSDFKASIEAEMEASQDFAKAINLGFMNLLERTWTSQYAIGRAIVANPDWSNEDIERYLNNIAQNDKTFKLYHWSNPQGVIITSLTPSAVNVDVSKLEYIKRIIDGEQMTIGDLQPRISDGELIAPIARGIRVGGKLKGIVINTIMIDDLENIISIDRMGERSAYGLIDKNATLVYHSEFKNLPIEKRKIKRNSIIEPALRGEVVRIYSVVSEIDGIEKMGGYYPIDEIGWCSMVSNPVGEVLAVKKQALVKNITIFALIYIFSFIIAILISNNFIISIGKLKDAANKVMNGDLSARSKINKNNYLYDVGQAFDNMVEVLNKREIEAEEYNNLKSQFLSNMSHELKTPLNIILGCVQVMERLDITDQEEFLDTLNIYIKMQKQNSYRLLRLINNIIDINKIETNHVSIKLSNNDVIKIVEDICISVVEYSKLKGIRIIFDTDIEEKIISFDVDMMERIILNLLSNAIKFTEDNGKIEVNINNTEENIMISVKDNGIGIPSDKIDMVFDIFAQADNSIRRRAEGSGIGLSLVKSLVELHGGTISVQSEYGKGSEFIIVLPNKTAEESIEITKEESILTVEKMIIEFSDIYL